MYDHPEHIAWMNRELAKRRRNPLGCLRRLVAMLLSSKCIK